MHLRSSRLRKQLVLVDHKNFIIEQKKCDINYEYKFIYLLLHLHLKMVLYYYFDRIQLRLHYSNRIKVNLEFEFIPRSIPRLFIIGWAITVVTRSSLTKRPSGYLSWSSLNIIIVFFLFIKISFYHGYIIDTNNFFCPCNMTSNTMATTNRNWYKISCLFTNKNNENYSWKTTTTKKSSRLSFLRFYYSITHSLVIIRAK